MRLWRNLDYIRKNFISNSIISSSEQKTSFDKYKVMENDFVFIVDVTTFCIKDKKCFYLNFFRVAKIHSTAGFLLTKQITKEKEMACR